MPNPIPQTVRIKRKRNQDPLEALLVDQKQGRDGDYVFKLAGTFDQEPGDPTDVLLQQDDTGTSTYRVAKRQKRELQEMHGVTARQRAYSKSHNVDVSPPCADSQAMSSLNDMVESYLHDRGPSASQAATGPVHQPIQDDHSKINVDAEVEDYVYDIYYRHLYTSQDKQAAQLQLKPGMGLIVFTESDLDDIADADSDVMMDDDEDSNAEDFYKNEYPDEDVEEEEREQLFDPSAPAHRGIPSMAPTTVGDMREGDYYTGHGVMEDDDEGGAYSDAHFDEQVNAHSPEYGGNQDEWSEDEDMQQYRDRILGDLESAIVRQD